jgi:hypothetical protein
MADEPLSNPPAATMRRLKSATSGKKSAERFRLER